MSAQKFQSFYFSVIEQIIPFFIPAVRAFSGVSGDHQNSRIGVGGFHILLRDGLKIRFFEGKLKLDDKRRLLSFLRQTVYFCLMSCFCLFEKLIIGRQPAVCRNGKTGILQSLLNVDDFTGVDITGTGTALDGMSCSCSVKSDLSGIF